ncbi:hypothetical protein QQF64_005652 [Cirrhinus molitorella]|uniref:Uncharacterized protein n=1 Tax=Cirrhinus molitorella TaxID=172907 RepID=A0ABR3MCW9_9TELE
MKYLQHYLILEASAGLKYIWKSEKLRHSVALSPRKALQWHLPASQEQFPTLLPLYADRKSGCRLCLNSLPESLLSCGSVCRFMSSLSLSSYAAVNLAVSDIQSLLSANIEQQ